MTKPGRSIRSKGTWRLVLGGIPLVALSIWSVRLIPQAERVHAAVAHCTNWVAEITRHHDSFVHLHERAYAMHHGASFGVEEASMAEAVDASSRSRADLTARTNHEPDPMLKSLDRVMDGYLAQLKRVIKATREAEDAREGVGSREAQARLSESLAHLSHQYEEVSSAYQALEAEHQRFLADAVHRMESHTWEMTAFAGTALMLALAYLLLSFRASRSQRRSEDSALFAHALLDTVPAGILLWDGDGRIHRSNQAMATMLGRRPEDLQDALLSDLLPRSAIRRLLRALGNGPISFNFTKEGGDLAAIEAHVAPVKSSVNLYRIAVFRDITGQLLADRRLQEHGRMTELGNQVTGVVLDLENLLNPLMLAVDMLRTGGGSRERTNDLLSLIERNGRSASELIGQLVCTVRQAEENARPMLFELNACLWESVASLEVGAGLHFDIDIPDEACIVRGHRSEVLEILRALLQRGAHVLGDGGNLCLKAREEGIVKVVDISDTADAIPEDMLGQAFSPVFLATCGSNGPDISGWIAPLRAMGGDLRVARDPAGLTIFSLLLPMASDRAAPEVRSE